MRQHSANLLFVYFLMLAPGSNDKLSVSLTQEIRNVNRISSPGSNDTSGLSTLK